ncbi:MAG: T9SS type A sorting domain-containing protein [Lewinella sp.]
MPHQFCQAGNAVSCDINKNVKNLKRIQQAGKWITNISTCLEQGYSPETCAKAATTCFVTNTISWGKLGAFGAWVSTFGLQQLMKSNCGDGRCFQCCMNEGQCHTSFEGFPVVNCNPIFGSGESAPGPTHILSATPGQFCLATPQICSHLPQCNYSLTVAEAEDINDDPDHPMKSEGALAGRRRWLADKMGEIWSDLDLRFGNLGPNGTVGGDFAGDSLYRYNYGDLVTFITGRGGVGWKEEPDPNFDWSNSIFDVYNFDSTAVDPILSKIRATKQAVITRTFASVPNFINRFNYLESRIWNDSSKAAYLAQIGDPDEELLKNILPINLEFLKILSEPPYDVIQDYRLFAVPLPDEVAGEYAGVYNATELGVAPRIYFDLVTMDDATLTAQIRVDELDLSTASQQAPVYIRWGDGLKEAHYLNDNGTLTVTHEYTAAGDFEVIAVVENNSGLRGVAGTLVSDVTPTTTGNPRLVEEMDIHEVLVRNVWFSNRVFTPFPSDVVLKFVGVDADGTRQEIGRSTRLRLVTNPADTAKIPFVRCEVPVGFNLRKIAVEVIMYNHNGFRVMWNVINEANSFWGFSGLEFVVSSDHNGRESFLTPAAGVSVSPSRLGSFYSHLEADSMGYDYNEYPELRPIPNTNLVRLPFIYEGRKFKGFEFNLGRRYDLDTVLTASTIPVADALVGSWQEIKPYQYVEVDNATAIGHPAREQILRASFFPNPASESGTVKFQLRKPSKVSVTIVDALGRTIRKLTEIDFPAGPSIHPIPLTALPPGLYMLNLRTTDGERASVSIVVQ